MAHVNFRGAAGTDSRLWTRRWGPSAWGYLRLRTDVEYGLIADLNYQLNQEFTRAGYSDISYCDYEVTTSFNVMFGIEGGLYWGDLGGGDLSIGGSIGGWGEGGGWLRPGGDYWGGATGGIGGSGSILWTRPVGWTRVTLFAEGYFEANGSGSCGGGSWSGSGEFEGVVRGGIKVGF